MFFFFKQKTAYEMRISDWSSDVCSSDLVDLAREVRGQHLEIERARARPGRELAPVIQRVGEFRIEPADAQELALAEIAADLHAGDALERFGDVLLGIFADVLGRDAVPDDIAIALVFDRALTAGQLGRAAGRESVGHAVSIPVSDGYI